MSKKTLILVVSLVLSLAVGLGGSLAYLTDRDAKINTFTAGDVEIEVEEDFDDGSDLAPGVEVNKDAKINNIGKTDAYVWMTVAVPADANDAIELTWVEGVTVEGPVEAQDEDGNTYQVYTAKYPEVLPVGESTDWLLDSVELDSTVDCIDGEYCTVVGGVVTPVDYDLSNLQLIVSGYAIQAEGFENIEDAYKAYGEQWGGMPISAPVEAADQAALAEAIANGATNINLGEGTFTIPAEAKGKDITIVGTKDTVIDATASYGQSISGADITLTGVTVKGQASGNYAGFTHIGSMTLNNCDVEGKITLYGETEFNNCTLTNMNDYNVWTWGGKDVAFNDCTFVTGGKALLVYGGASADCKHTEVAINNCVFESDASLATDKAAIETGTDYADVTYNITINDTTVDEAFGIGKNTDTKVWANKNSMTQETLNVVIDGTDVY